MRTPQIQLIPLRAAVSDDQPTTLDVLVKILRPEEEIVERPPLNIGFVIDRSGSMAGKKIEHVRQAAAYAVELLLPTDRVSVVVYDVAVETIVQNTLAEEKAPIVRAISGISSGGQTALHDGWVQGGIQVSRHLDPERLNRVILLTDGLANAGEINPDVIASDARGLADRGVSTSTMGVGLGYNEDLLEAMARSGDGNYYYIRSPEQCPGIFDRELHGLAATLGTDVVLEIRPSAAVSLQRVLNKLETAGENRYRLPNLTFDRPLSAVFRLEVPPMTRESVLCTVGVSWRDEKRATRGELEAALNLPSVSSRELEKCEPNPEVRQQVALLRAARAREEAVILVDRGEMQEAIRTLQEARQEMRNNPDLPLMASEAEALSDLEEQLRARKISVHHKLSKYHSYSISHGHMIHSLRYRYVRGPTLGDITQQNVDAIVNSAGYNFLSHGPLSQSIIRAAGPRLLAELQSLGDCGYGEARITGGYDLPARWVIHTVVPPWQGGIQNEGGVLAQCYRSCLDLAVRQGIHTIAFPALGTGNLGFYPVLAAEIAFQVTNLYLQNNITIGQVRFVCYESQTLEAFAKVFESGVS